MNEESMSATMFWVGVLFAFTPILVAGIVIGTTWYHRRKKRGRGAEGERDSRIVG